jgi:UDP-N-acetylglucosamine 2-epimerase (non-hydrolysing)
MKKVLFVLGTRPEAVKLSPLIRLAKSDSRFEVLVCSTGQHREMLKPVFELFGIKPDFDFQIMRPGQTLHSVTTGILEGMKDVLQAQKPDWVVVQGDTTTTMAAALAAFYERCRVAHVEAGLRTGDIESPFPEELNRRIAGLISKLHFAPTEAAANHLRAEGVPEDSLLVTGNTGIDALFLTRATLRESNSIGESIRRKFGFLNPEKKLILVTVHRRESFGEPIRRILKSILSLAERADVEIIVPLHMNPEVRRAAAEVLGSSACWVSPESTGGMARIWLTEPQDYPDFIYLMDRSHFIISDSGGVQEEAPSLGKPVLVVRESTERPEAILAGTSKLVGSRTEDILSSAFALLDDPVAYKKMANGHNPFGDGKACQRILSRLADF